MFESTPPAPKALPDAELNAKIAQLQLQPDGLVAAMAFIEEQSKLRQEDALELSKWQLQAQMIAATEPAKVDPVNLQDPITALKANSPHSTPASNPLEPVQSEPAQAEVDIFASVGPKTVNENPTVGQVPPANENIEDIVAKLNASYAEVATEEVAATPAQTNSAPGVETLTSPPNPVAAEEFPEPLVSPVLVEESGSSFSSPETSIEQSEQAEFDEKDPTRTSFGFSWSWLAVSSSPLSLVLAALIKESSVSLAQSVILLSGILLITSLLAGVGAMAAARGSSSLVMVSRAAFGVWGNAFPASLVFAVKLFWAAALVYFAGRIISPLVSNQPWFAELANQLIFPAEFTASLFVIIPIAIAAILIAGFGGLTMLRSQQVVTVFSVIGLGAFGYFIASNYSIQDLSRGEAIGTLQLADLGIFVFAIMSLAVISQSGDFARKLRNDTPSAKVFFLTIVSTFFLPLVIGLAGLLWLFMAEPEQSGLFSTEVFASIAAVAPVWVFVLFVIAIGLSLLQLVASSFYSLSGNLRAIVKIPAWVSASIVFVAVVAAVLVPNYLVAVSSLQEAILELFYLAAVVASAWLGIVISDALVRRRGYHEVSLTREYEIGRAHV